MAGLLLPGLLFALSAGCGAAVWPQPQFLRVASEGGCRLSATQFRFDYANSSAVGPGCVVLDQAFQRYWKLLFPHDVKNAGQGCLFDKTGKTAAETNLL